MTLHMRVWRAQLSEDKHRWDDSDRKERPDGIRECIYVANE
jgi:hypothetical protein